MTQAKKHHSKDQDSHAAKSDERDSHSGKSHEKSGAQSNERGQHSGRTGEHASHSPVGIQKALKGAKYPADKKSLLDTAQANGADKSTLRMLHDMPDGHYDSPAKVSKALGEES